MKSFDRDCLFLFSLLRREVEILPCILISVSMVGSLVPGRRVAISGTTGCPLYRTRGEKRKRYQNAPDSIANGSAQNIPKLGVLLWERVQIEIKCDLVMLDVTDDIRGVFP